MEKNIPMVLRRIKAVDINKMKMGRYKVLNYKESYFYIMDCRKPIVAIGTKDNKLIVINYQDYKKTEDLYKSLEQFKK
ncbi:hypothetical protein HAHI6034_03165 [Hathewaya histolytica]|uniref:Uncharacterized protein n=1 Tax=Hathewaya histolytica TaxID=1498 RepID=A0A4U9R985_HATHI|nr:hypothetical protein [Hathewaya histolytica]VTQ85250.1 Uncharacterised protein [Hathewaya histolytica]